MLTATRADTVSIQFASADFTSMLHYIGQHVPWHRDAILQVPGDKLTVLFYMDECTGGNVLATASNKRMYFFYAAIKELGYLNCKTAFLPWACIPAKDLSLEDGPNMASVTRAILQDWVAQQLEQGCVLHGRRFRVFLECLLADYDAIRQILDTKGAAALKPCALCSNVLSKARAEAESDPFFVTISSCDQSRFVGYNMMEFFAIYDDMLHEAQHLTKTRLKEKEKIFGFFLNKNCLFADPNLRMKLNLDHLIIDSTHCYYANGIASQELLLMMQIFEKKHGITTEMWQQTIRDVPWRCRDEHFRAPSARAFLFQQSFWSGEMFKGSASQVWFLLPWLHFHMHQLAIDHNASEWKSFSALLKCHYALRAIRNGAHDYEKLNQAQLEHHHWFGSTWGDLLRPKHHLRLHLASIYRKFGYADAFPCEKKHQDYKTMLSQTQACLYKQGTGKISLYILGRMLLQNTTELEEEPWSDGMIPPIHSEEEVSETFPGFNARVSRGYRLRSITLTPDTPVLWANFSGIVQFFALEKNIIFMIYEELEPLESTVPWSKRFQCTGRWNAINVTSLASSNVPCWWLKESQILTCLE